MATWPKILHLRRTDVPKEHLLLNVAKDGSQPLDIKFICTDQETLFSGSIRDSGVKALQAGNYNGALADFKTVLIYVLLHQRPQGPLPEILKDVEAVSAISGTTATLTIRKNVGGVTQKLGSLKLEQTSVEIDVFEWVDAAVQDADALRSQLENLQASVISRQHEIAKLNSDLDNLVKAKKSHEDELLSKFAALLNAKKLKIRDQERLLQGGRQVHSSSTTSIVQARSQKKPSVRQARASRGSKRKAESSVVSEDEEAADEEADDGSVPEDGTVTDDDDDEERRRQLTPETDDDNMDVDAVTEAVVEPGDVSNESQSSRRVPARQSQTTSIQRDSSLSRRRDLPTRQRKAANREPTPPPTSNVGDVEADAETDDDEL